MKKQDLLDALELLDDQFIEEADEAPVRRHRSPWRQYAAVAACLVVMCGSLIAWHQSGNEFGGEKETTREESMVMHTTKNEYTETAEVETAKTNVSKTEGSRVESSSADVAKISESSKSNASKPTEENTEDDWTMNEFTYRTASLVLSEGYELYSPMSLYYSLFGMMMGAGEETQEELVNILGGVGSDGIWQRTKSMLDDHAISTYYTTMQVANSVWVNPWLGEVSNTFSDQIRGWLNGEVYTGDLDSAEMQEEMQRWIEENANGQLQYELEGDSLMLLNTIFFQSSWEVSFDPAATTEEIFILQDGSEVTTSFMNKQNIAQFYECEQYYRSEMPLRYGKMIFVLPKTDEAFQEIIRDPELLEQAFNKVVTADYNVTWKIPQFTCEQKLELLDILEQLGVESVFGETADYSGVGKKGIVPTNITLDGINQVLNLRISENGVGEAVYSSRGYLDKAEEEREMILNRPFLYAILDDNDNVLFIGTCMDPTAE